MMWQKVNGKYHLLLNGEGVEDGRMLQTACENIVDVRHKNQVPYVSYGGKMCEICKGVWHIVFTSVSDAKTSLRDQTNKQVIHRCLELTTSITLKKSLEARLRKLERQGA